MSTGYPWLSLLLGHRPEIQEEITSFIGQLSANPDARSLVVKLHTLNMGMDFPGLLPEEFHDQFVSELPPQLEVRQEIAAGSLAELISLIKSGNKAVIEKIDSAQVVTSDGIVQFQAQVAEAVKPRFDSLQLGLTAVEEELQFSRDREERLDLACDELGEWLNDRLNLEMRLYPRLVEAGASIAIGRLRETKRLLDRFERSQYLFAPEKRKHLQGKVDLVKGYLDSLAEKGPVAASPVPQVVPSESSQQAPMLDEEEDLLPAADLIKPGVRLRRNREPAHTGADEQEEKHRPRVPVQLTPTGDDDDEDLGILLEDQLGDEPQVEVPTELQPGQSCQTIADSPIAASLQQLRDQLPDDNAPSTATNDPDELSAPDD